MLDADALKVVLIQTGQYRDREHDRPAQFFLTADALDFFDRRAHHLQTAGSVNVEHFDAEPRCFDGGFSDGVGNVMKFEIEKDLAAELLDQLYRLGPGMGEKLLADLEHAEFSGEQLHKPLGLIQRVDIKGDDQSLAHGTGFNHQLELRSHVYACNVSLRIVLDR